MQKRKILLIAASFIFISAITFFRANYLCTTIVDDAFIFFRYAGNIFSGHGFVWNLGEAPVEGYSSFLYLIVLTGGRFLTSDLVSFSIIFGIICSVFTLYFSFLIYELIYPDLITENCFTIFLIAVSPVFVYWSASGMDSIFYSTFLLFTIFIYLKLPATNISSFLKGILFGFLCMIRFEGLLIVLFIFSHQFFIILRNNISGISPVEVDLAETNVSKGSFVKLFLTAIGFVIIFGTYFTWRWHYFGYFLPNTFYAKVGDSFSQLIGGFIYLLNSFRVFYGLGWLPIIFVLLFFRLKMLSAKARLVIELLLVSILGTTLIGGDHFFPGRFILPVFPLLFVVFPPAFKKFLLSAEFRHKTFGTNRFYIRKLFPIKIKPKHILLVFSIIIFIVLIDKPVYKETVGGIANLINNKKEIVIVRDDAKKEYVVEWQQAFILMGKALKKIGSKNQYIAAVPIGAIGYYSNMKVIDMVGIVNPVIGHEKFSKKYLKKWLPGHEKGDGKYILSRKPEYIQLTNYLTRKPREIPDSLEFRFKSVNEIWNSKEFRKDYKHIWIQVTKGWYYNLYKRKDFN